MSGRWVLCRCEKCGEEIHVRHERRPGPYPEDWLTNGAATGVICPFHPGSTYYMHEPDESSEDAS